MRILAISGSLRAVSSNTELLRAAALLAPAGMEVVPYTGLDALLNASPRATHAQASLAETVRTMSGRVVEGASVAVPLLARGLDAAAIAADPEASARVRGALAALAEAVRAGVPAWR